MEKMYSFQMGHVVNVKQLCSRKCREVDINFMLLQVHEISVIHVGWVVCMNTCRYVCHQKKSSIGAGPR